MSNSPRNGPTTSTISPLYTAMQSAVERLWSQIYKFIIDSQSTTNIFVSGSTYPTFASLSAKPTSTTNDVPIEIMAMGTAALALTLRVAAAPLHYALTHVQLGTIPSPAPVLSTQLAQLSKRPFDHGVRSLWKGTYPALAPVALNSLQIDMLLRSWRCIRRKIQRGHKLDATDSLCLLTNVLGVPITFALCYPLVVVSTRMMVDRSHNSIYKGGIINTMQTIATTEGSRALLRGVGVGLVGLVPSLMAALAAETLYSARASMQLNYDEGNELSKARVVATLAAGGIYLPFLSLAVQLHTASSTLPAHMRSPLLPQNVLPENLTARSLLRHNVYTLGIKSALFRGLGIYIYAMAGFAAVEWLKQHTLRWSTFTVMDRLSSWRLV